jgi:antitoxin component HigA of HigAB toxin-antitoxin module
MEDRIIDEDDYRKALRRFLEICNAPEGTPEAEELKQISQVIDAYERENFSGFCYN